MKRSFALLAFVLGAGLILNSCVKNEPVSYEEQMQSSGSVLYSYGTAYHYQAMGPAYIALRLNTLLYEADNHVDGDGDPDPIDITDPVYRAVDIMIGSATVDVRAKLFSNATFQRTNPGEPNETVTITYPNNYDSRASADYEYRGKITFATSGNQLADDQNPATWQVRMDNDAPLSRSGIYLEWGGGNYTINDMRVYANDFRSYYPDFEELGSSWAVEGYWLEPGAAYRAAPSYVNYSAMVLQHGGSSSGTLMKNSATEPELTVYYTVSAPLTTQFKCSMNAFTAGTETVSSPDFKAANPESFPESSAKMVWSRPDESACTRHGVLTYAGYSNQYTF